MEAIIRPAAKTDAKSLTKIFNQAQRFKLSLGDTAWDTIPYSEEELRKRIAEGDDYVLLIDGDIAGGFQLNWEDKLNWGKQPPTAGYLHQMAISDRYRGQNLGALIINWASNKVLERDRNLLRLDCPPANTKLCNYYKKLGFQEVKTVEIKTPRHVYSVALFERRAN